MTRRHTLIWGALAALAAGTSWAQQTGATPPAGAAVAPAPAPAAAAPAATADTAPTTAAPAAAKPTAAKPATGKSAATRSAAAGAATRPKSAAAGDRIDLDAAQITGNRELPKVLYIVPWKRPDLGDLLGKPVNSLLDEVLAPVDRDVFKRENRYFEALQPAGRPAAEPTATPGGSNPAPSAKPEP